MGCTIFNEGWGQYDSDRIFRACKAEDPSRFYISTSGWFAQRESDIQSEHLYFRTQVRGAGEEEPVREISLVQHGVEKDGPAVETDQRPPQGRKPPDCDGHGHSLP